MSAATPSSEIHETERFVEDAVDRIASMMVADQGAGKGPFVMSLCGGGTPKPIYEGLARHTGIDWDDVVLTFGDERCVPPDDPQSNYRMVKESLIDPAGVPERNVVRIEGERPPAEAAALCQERLAAWVRGGSVVLRHDLMLLGMGEDGHTASLFPGTSALEERDQWVVANEVPQLDTWRISFTYPLINASRRVLFLVSGAKKRPILEKVWAGGSGFPVESVRPLEGERMWLVGS